MQAFTCSWADTKCLLNKERSVQIYFCIWIKEVGMQRRIESSRKIIPCTFCSTCLCLNILSCLLQSFFMKKQNIVELSSVLNKVFLQCCKFNTHIILQYILAVCFPTTPPRPLAPVFPLNGHTLIYLSLLLWLLSSVLLLDSAAVNVIE